MARKKLPDSLKRAPLYGRVRPETDAFLRTLGEPNQGRAVDKLVELLRKERRALKIAKDKIKMPPAEVASAKMLSQ
jgi:hypothetical protein